MGLEREAFVGVRCYVCIDTAKEALEKEKVIEENLKKATKWRDNCEGVYADVQLENFDRNVPTDEINASYYVIYSPAIYCETENDCIYGEDESEVKSGMLYDIEKAFAMSEVWLADTDVVEEEIESFYELEKKFDEYNYWRE